MSPNGRRGLTPLKKIILVYALTVVAGLLLVNFYLHAALQQAALERWRIDQGTLASNISALIGEELEEGLLDLQLVADLPAFDGLPFADLVDPEINGLPEYVDLPKRNTLKAMRRHFSTLFVLQPSGDHYLTEPFLVQISLKKFNLADMPYFQRAAESGVPVVSDSFLGGDGVLAVVMDLPALDEEGEIVLHLGGVLHLDRLSQLVALDRIGRFDAAFLVDGMGHLIAHTDQTLLAPGVREGFAHHPLVADYASGSRRKEPLEFTGPADGNVYLGSFLPMSHGWGLGLMRSEDSIHAEMRFQQRKIFWLVAAILLGIGGIGGPFVSRIGRGWEAAERQLMEARNQLEERVAERTGQLRRSQGQLQAIIDNTTSLIYLKDLQGRYLLINRSFEELFSCSREAMAGRSDYNLFAKELADSFRANDQLALERGGPVEIEEQVPVGDELHTYISVKFPVRDEDGNFYGVCGVSTDITGRKEVENELREVDRMKNEFLSMAAHELRTPLTLVLGYSELLQDNALDEEQRLDALAVIREKATVLEKIIDELLDVSRAESGRVIHLEKESLDPTEEVAALIEDYRRAYPDNCFEMQFEQNGGLKVLADRQKLRQAVENLLANAVKFSPPQSCIDIRCEATQTGVLIAVADSGVGLSPEEAKRVFDKFYRVDASDSARSGLGLGLTIARNIVEAHGGRIWLESEAGQGTTVFLSLPWGGGEFT